MVFTTLTYRRGMIACGLYGRMCLFIASKRLRVIGLIPCYGAIRKNGFERREQINRIGNGRINYVIG